MSSFNMQAGAPYKHETGLMNPGTTLVEPYKKDMVVGTHFAFLLIVV